VTTTVKDYDLTETGKLMRGVLVVRPFHCLRPTHPSSSDPWLAPTTQGIGFMGFLHIYMKYTQPLFIQAIMTLKGVLECVISPDPLSTPSGARTRHAYPTRPAFLFLSRAQIETRHAPLVWQESRRRPR
jgi:hypothetical protein